MQQRPKLQTGLDKDTFLSFYYLKEELVSFCRENGLPSGGSKQELTERIALFLETGRAEVPKRKTAKKAKPANGELTLDTEIEQGFVCSERHRAFFKEHIGRGFSFNVAFQRWLKANAGRTYADAVQAYRDIAGQKKTTKSAIGSQFEYNTYIRDFFADNKGRMLGDAIKCWKYKKSLPGHDRYERDDLKALDE